MKPRNWNIKFQHAETEIKLREPAHSPYTNMMEVIGAHKVNLHAVETLGLEEQHLILNLNHWFEHW